MKKLFIIGYLLFVIGCHTYPQQTKEPALQPPSPPIPEPTFLDIEKTNIKETPYLCHKDAWIHTPPPDSLDKMFFVGMSDSNHLTEKVARDYAFQDSLKQFTSYCGIEVKTMKTLTTKSVETESNSHYNVTMNEHDSFSSKAVAIHFKPEQWCVQEFTDQTPHKWKVYVLSSIPKKSKEWIQTQIQKPQPKTVVNVPPPTVEYPLKPLDIPPIKPQDSESYNLQQGLETTSKKNSVKKYPLQSDQSVFTYKSETKNYKNDTQDTFQHRIEPDSSDQSLQEYPIQDDFHYEDSPSEEFKRIWR